MDNVKQAINKLISIGKRSSVVLKNKQSPLFIQNIIGALVCGFLFATCVNNITNTSKLTELDYVKNTNMLVYLFTMVLASLITLAVDYLLSINRFVPTVMLIFTTILCVQVTMCIKKDIWMGCGIAVIALIVSIWATRNDGSLLPRMLSKWVIAQIGVVCLFTVFVFYLAITTICRNWVYGTNCFDFGIFAQMFDYMKETGIPYTTCERNVLVSHFAIHFSPIFYILLPGYFLFPCPEYLLSMQALFVGAGVFAVYGIAKHFGFSSKITLAVCAIYIFYPSMSYGLYNEFHENKFLTFFILWTFYFLLKKKWFLFYPSTVLLCAVKEDAPIYLFVIALYMILSQKLFKHGIITAVLALVYFVFALVMIDVSAGNIINDASNQFMYRYGKYSLEGEQGIGVMLKILFTDIGYVISQMFTKEKLEFLVWMLLPVLFMPFTTKKVSNLVLLSPLIIINLMTDWEYQFNVDFQYTFGVGALIIICFLIALKEMSPKRRRMIVCAALIVSVSVTLPETLARGQSCINGYMEREQYFDERTEFIRDNIPKDAVISAGGGIVPKLWDRPNVYLEPYEGTEKDKVNYYISDTESKYIQQMKDQGFKFYKQYDNIVIYKR